MTPIPRCAPTLAEQPTSPTRALAAFVADAPAGVASPRAQAVQGSAARPVRLIVAGAGEEAGRLARDYAVAQAAAGPAAVFGGRPQVSPALAALVNGTAGHALDFDDIGLGAGHVSVAIVPAVFAVAEQIGADGRPHSRRAGLALRGRAPAHHHVHRHPARPVRGRVPQAGGVLGLRRRRGLPARLLGLDADATANAFGIAASQAGGLRANFGTMTKPLHAGLANRTGIEAALLGAVRASPRGRRPRAALRLARRDLPGRGRPVGRPRRARRRYAVEEGLVFKAYPCCGANHYAIDAVIARAPRARARQPDVARLDVGMEQRNLNDVLVYPWARAARGQVLAAVQHGRRAGRRRGHGRHVHRRGVGAARAFRDKVHVHPTADLPRTAPGSGCSPATAGRSTASSW